MLIGRLVKQANNAMNQEMNAFAQQYGLTGTQMSIIDFLTHFPGNSCDQHQIENEFGIKRSTTTVLLQRIAKKNMIECYPSPEDRRQKIVTLTAEGQKLSSDVSAYITQYEIKTILINDDREEIMSTNTEKIPTKVVAAIVATGLMSFCGVIVETAMNVTFPILMREFSITTNQAQWMTSIYLLLVAIVVPLSAILKSSYRTKMLFTVANLLFISGIIIDALAPLFGVLLVGRTIQGIGTGIALPLMFNIIMEQVPTSRIGFMMGSGNLITGVAPAIGPTFGGIVASKLNWRWVFYSLIPLLIISFVLGEWGITQKSPIKKQQIDLFSILMIVFMFCGFVTEFSNLGSQAFMTFSVGGALLIGILGMGLFARRSLTLKEPILQLRLFRNKKFSGHILGFFLTQLISLGFAFLLPNYIQLVNGNSAMTAGLIVLPAGFVGAIFAPLRGGF